MPADKFWRSSETRTYITETIASKGVSYVVRIESASLIPVINYGFFFSTNTSRKFRQSSALCSSTRKYFSF